MQLLRELGVCTNSVYSPQEPGNEAMYTHASFYSAI